MSVSPPARKPSIALIAGATAGVYVYCTRRKQLPAPARKLRAGLGDADTLISAAGGHEGEEPEAALHCQLPAGAGAGDADGGVMVAW